MKSNHLCLTQRISCHQYPLLVAPQLQINMPPILEPTTTAICVSTLQHGFCEPQSNSWVSTPITTPEHALGFVGKGHIISLVRLVWVALSGDWAHAFQLPWDKLWALNGSISGEESWIPSALSACWFLPYSAFREECTVELCCWMLAARALGLPWCQW